MSKSILMVVLACMISSARAHSHLNTMKSTIAYTETVDCGSVSLTDIFRRARLWASQSAPDDKTLVSDKETGDLVTQGQITVTIPRSEKGPGGIYRFRYVLSIECANRKYRVSVANVALQDANGPYYTPLEVLSQKADYQPVIAELDSKIKAMLADLQTNVKDYKSF